MGRWDKNEVSQDFNKNLQRFFDGKMGSQELFGLGSVPAWLQRLGVPDSRSLTVSCERLTGGADNALLESLRNLPDLLQHPLAVFSGNTDHDMRVILDVEPKKHQYVCLKMYTKNSECIGSVRPIGSAAEMKILRLIQEDRSLYLDKMPLKNMCGRVGERLEQVGIYHVTDVYDKILDFDNYGKNKFDIDDYLSQVGPKRMPYTGSEAVDMYRKLSASGISYGNHMKEEVFKDAVGYFALDSSKQDKWKVFDFSSGILIEKTFDSMEAARNFALGFESEEYTRQMDATGGIHESEYIEGTHSQKKDEVREFYYQNLKELLNIALPVGSSLKFSELHLKYDSAVGKQNNDFSKVAHVPGGFVIEDKKGHAIGVEHLDKGSLPYLWGVCQVELAKQTIYERVTDSSKGFSNEQVNILNACSKGLTEKQKQELFNTCLLVSVDRFQKEGIYKEWFDDVREELQDLSKGVVRGEGLGRK